MQHPSIVVTADVASNFDCRLDMRKIIMVFSTKLRYRTVPYLLLFPSMLLIGVFKVYPILYSIFESFFKSGKGGVKSFVGLSNYLIVLSEPTFANSLKITLWFCLITTTIQIVLALALALFVNKSSLFVRISRTLIYIPVSISMVIACTIWSMFFNPSIGIFNTLLDSMGLPKQLWLSSPNQALYVILFICSWKGISYWMMFLLAGLQNISMDIFEAARLDGARYLRVLFQITIPMLKNALIFVIVSDSLINIFMFVPVYLLTNGGPSMSTDTLMYEAYRSAFSYGNYPRAYVLVTIMLFIAIVIAVIQLNLTRERTQFSSWRSR